MTNDQPLAEAFHLGRKAYQDGQSETANPYNDGRGNSHQTMKAQWMRGYRNTRKRARFDATIKARQNKGNVL